MIPTVVAIEAADTHPLRASVLRRDVPATDVVFAEDSWPGVMHLGVRLIAVDAAADGTGNELIAVSTWVPRPVPDDIVARPHGLAVQLRGMATAWHAQGTGIGGMLVEAGVDRVGVGGADVVWARARDSALDFYLRHGFAVVGDGFVDANTQLPHHVIVRSI